MRIVLLTLLTGCAGAAATGSEETASGEFCSTLADGGTFLSEDGGGNGSSGLIDIRMLTNESVDINDPLYVAFKSYTLENLDSGGVKTVGQTSGDGLVSELLGAGNWSFSAAYTRGSLTCLANLELPVTANGTTLGCPVMECP